MGGFGSGMYSRDDTRVPVERCYSIDINYALQQGALRPCVYMTMRWFTEDAWGGTETRASIGVEGAPRGIKLHYTTTDYKGNETKHDYSVPVVWTRCHFGGRRPYFICPGIVNGVTCMRRVAKLYKAPASAYFLCRHCHNLTY